MSMLTAQCDRLRETADEVERIKHNNADWLWRDGITLTDAARELRDAADTIKGLLNRLTDTKEVETCRMEQVLDCDELPQPRFWQCHGCGETFIYQRAWYPTYCPECGRKRVVE